MLKAMRTLLLRMGAIGALMMALMAAAPAVAASCAPEAEAAIVAVGLDQASANTPDSDGCIDCGPACQHQCCHAPHVALPAAELSRIASPHVQGPLSWTHAPGQPAAAPCGPDRPPRS